MLNSINAAITSQDEDTTQMMAMPLAAVEVIQENSNLVVVQQPAVEQQLPVVQVKEAMTSQALSCIASMTEMINSSYSYPQVKILEPKLFKSFFNISHKWTG